MGRPLNKTFLELEGKPVLWHTVSRLTQVPTISEIVLLVNASDLPHLERHWKTALLELGVDRILVGGARRQDTVFEGVRNCRAGVDDLVLIHDAVRPFVRVHVVEQVIERAAETGAAIAAIPADSTVKECDGERILRTIPRERLWLAQTPQVFRKKLLAQALEYAQREGIGVTDDAQLLELLGQRVEVVPGNRANIKITTPDDLELARAMIAGQRVL